MFTRKKSVKKQFTPIRGKREQALKIKRFFIVLLAIVVLCGAFFALRKVAGIIFNTEARPAWLEWHVKRINITGEKGDIIYEVEKYIPFEEGASITHSDVSSLKRILKVNLKEVKDISVWRNFFNGNLNIKIKKHQAYVRIKTLQKIYLMEESGLVFNDDKSPEYDKLFEVMAEGQIKTDLLPKEFVELIKALKSEKELDIKDVYIDIENSSFTLKLDGVSANMGGLSAGPEKLVYLKRILDKSETRKFKKPFEVNFDYFNDGKIYLKPTM